MADSKLFVCMQHCSQCLLHIIPVESASYVKLCHSYMSNHYYIQNVKYVKYDRYVKSFLYMTITFAAVSPMMFVQCFLINFSVLYTSVEITFYVVLCYSSAFSIVFKNNICTCHLFSRYQILLLGTCEL